MSRIKCNLINYCDYRFGFCRCFEGYEDYCIDLCPKHNISLLPASERKRIKKQNNKWSRIRAKKANALRAKRINRLIERLKNEDFQLKLYIQGEITELHISNFYAKKYNKKSSLVIESPEFGLLYFGFLFDNSDSENLVEKKTIYLRCSDENEIKFKDLTLDFSSGESNWFDSLLDADI